MPRTGVTSLVTLALLAAGEKPDSPAVRKALEYLRGFGPDDLHSTYAISLQTQVFAAAEPDRDQLRIVANVAWLERAQIKPGDPQSVAGLMDLLGLEARPGPVTIRIPSTPCSVCPPPARSGVPVKPSVWELARSYWER